MRGILLDVAEQELTGSAEMPAELAIGHGQCESIVDLHHSCLPLVPVSCPAQVTLAMAVAMMAGLAVPVVAEGAICVEASGEVCVDEFQSFAGRGAGNDRQAGLLKVRFGAMAEPATEHGVHAFGFQQAGKPGTTAGASDGDGAFGRSRSWMAHPLR